MVFGALNLGGSINMIPNAVQIDELWTRISIEFYKDSADAVFKALVE